MTKFYIILFLLLNSLLFAQTQNDTVKQIILDGIVVNSQKFAKSKRKITQQVESISAKEIEFLTAQNTADLLQNSGTLSIQKSQQGGGSPIIRGFEASRVLLLVDGVRMNNLIFRSGHLQNSITINQNMLENIDVLFGPSSTIYGSDALGGAIYFQTKSAKTLSKTKNKLFTGSVMSTYSTVNEGKMAYADLNYAAEKFASLTAFAINDYGDLMMGRQQNGSQPFFGERPFYITPNNSIDTKTRNDNRYLQKFSGYKQYDFIQKFVFNANDNIAHSLNFQYSTSTNIPRYDRLTDTNPDGSLRFATWDYGPQNRLLAAYNIKKKKVFSNTDLNLTLSYQNIEESRISRRVDRVLLDNQVEKVAVFALNSDFKTKLGTADFVYGFDMVYDNLKSSAFSQNILTNAETSFITRYPDGKNNMLSTEIFALFHKNLSTINSFNASFRGGYKVLNSELNTNPLNLPTTIIQQKNLTYSGAIGYAHNPSRNTKMAFNISSGFRVPNIDDLGKIFDSNSVRAMLIVPNFDLKPEKTIAADMGISFWRGNKFQLENNFYVTKLYDALVTSPFAINGQTSLVYNGVLSKVTANQNQGRGTIAGVSTTMKIRLLKNLIYFGTFNFTHGRISNNNDNFPLDHIPPIFGQTGFKFNSKNMNLELNMIYNGSKNLSDYSPSGEDNLVYAPANGTPSWECYNLKTSFNFLENTTIFASIENILDTQYRTFASGINAAGRNFQIGFKYVL
jgi:hemoglobin/transferrin/lactoferrin receptor protein